MIGGPEEVTQEQILEDLSYVQLKHLVDEKILAVDGEGYIIMKPYAFHDYIMEHTPHTGQLYSGSALSAPGRTVSDEGGRGSLSAGP